MSEVIEGKLKYYKQRISKTSQTIKQRNKLRETKHKEEKVKNTNKIKVLEIMKKNTTHKQ